MAEQGRFDLLEFDAERAAAEKNIESIREALKSAIRLYTTAHIDDPRSGKEAAYQIRMTDRLDAKYQADNNIDYVLGVFRGWLKAFEVFYRAQTGEDRARRQIDAKFGDIPHFEDILFTIREQEGIRHGELAERVGIEKSTLTSIMERVIRSGTVIFSRPGKFKYYYLTEVGKRYCETHQQRHDLKSDKQAVMDSVLALLHRTDHPEEFVGKLMKRIYENKSTGYAPQETRPAHNKDILNQMSQVLNSENVRVHLSTDDYSETVKVKRTLLSESNQQELDIYFQGTPLTDITVMQNKKQEVI